MNTRPRFCHGHSSVTSPAIMHPCSCLARTATWREHSQFPMMCSADNTCSPWIFFFSRYFFFSYQYLERLTIIFSVPLLFLQVWIKKNSKFESTSEGRVIGNSLRHHGKFSPFKYIFPVNSYGGIFLILIFFRPIAISTVMNGRKKIEIRKWGQEN